MVIYEGKIFSYFTSTILHIIHNQSADIHILEDIRKCPLLKHESEYQCPYIQTRPKSDLAVKSMV